VQALQVNSEASLSKQCDRKFRVVETSRVVPFPATRAGLTKVEREKQDVISKLLSASSSSSNKSRSQIVKEQNHLFKDFDYSARKPIGPPNDSQQK
jgi:hypothetical protein